MGEPPEHVVGVDEPGSLRPVEGVGRRGRVDATDLGEVPHAELVTQGGAAAQDPAALLIELVHPVDDRVDGVDLAEERAEHPVVVGADGRRDAALLQQAEGRSRPQRVTTAQAVDEAEEGGTGLGDAEGVDESHLIGG
jgi:hypothetical protein